MNNTTPPIKRLIVDARMIRSSGIGRYLLEILLRIKHDFDIVCLINGKDIDYFSHNSLRYKVFNAKIYSISEQLFFSKYLEKDCLFWSPHFNVPLFNVKCKIRVVTIHDAYHLAFFQKLSIIQKIYAKIFYRFAINKSDKVITVSDFSKQELRSYIKGIATDKIQVIHNGVTIPSIQEEVSGNENRRKRYFLFVGNIKPHKNLKKTILAFEQLLKEHPENIEKIQFKIVGKKDGFITGVSELASLIEENEILKQHISFTGHISDEELFELYRDAFYFIFPSYYEGFGLPPLEAMACGCPTIVSNSASLPEICGDASLYFNPFDIQDIYLKMKKAIDDENIRNQLIERGYARIKLFSWAKSAKQHMNLFKDLLQNENCLNSCKE